jgi:hypothetical protein
MIHNSSRRQFIFGCLGFPAALGADAIRPKISISSDFAQPKFAIGEEVVAPWENEEGMHYSRAIIIGMMHDPYGYEVNGWWYLPAWIDNPQCPWMNGRDDGHFWHESYLKPMPKLRT